MNPPVSDMPEHGSPEWHEWRRQGVGASEAGAACGVSEWKSRLQLWQEKIGEAAPIPDSPAMKWGRRHEAYIVEDMAEILCCEVDEYPGLTRKPSGVLYATPDAVLLMPDGSRELLECKSTTWRTELGEDDSDGIPFSWLVQTQMQMLCCGVDVCRVGVLVDGRNLRRFTIIRSESLIQSLLLRISPFWQYVQTRQMPPPDWGNVLDVEWIKANTRPRLGTSEDWSDNAEFRRLVEERDQVKASIKVDELHLEELNARILHAMNGVQSVRCGERELVYEQRHRKAFSVKASSHWVLTEKKVKTC